MTKLSMEEIADTLGHSAQDRHDVTPDQALAKFMQDAARSAAELSQIITPVIDKPDKPIEVSIVGLLLYVANIARRATGASLQDFLASAEQAFTDAEELFATAPIEVLKKARAVLARPNGWCQGDMAFKWVRDKTRPEGKRLVNCHVDDQYASRWSLLGAIEAAADSKRNREMARDFVVSAIREASFAFNPGELTVTIINNYNDHGWAPPIPPLVIPEPPPETVWEQKITVYKLPGGPDAPHQMAEELTVKENYDRTVAKMKADYENFVVKDWPKPAVPGRTREEVLALLDRAIALAGGE